MKVIILQKQIKTLICFALSFLTVISFASCGCESSQTSQSTTTQAQTTQPNSTQPQTTQPIIEATPDTPQNELKVEYDYKKIKKNEEKIKNTLDYTIKNTNFKGTVYLKVGGNFEYIGTNGLADKDKHTNNSITTCYRIGSVTKQFTAVAIMMLQEQGKLSTEDTLDKYYPSYKYGKDIKIKNLLNMTAGLRDYLCYDGNVASAFYGEDYLEYKISKDNSAKENKKSILNWILKQELNFEVGSQFQFSNSSYYILGDIIEKASGTSYETFIKDNIIKPLDLSSTGFKSTKALAQSYQDIYDNEWTLYPGVGYSSVWLISDVPDLLVWAESVTDFSIISEDSFKEMTDPSNGRYGYGFFLEDDGMEQKGKIEMFNSQMFYDSDLSVIFIALSNYTQSHPNKIYYKFRDVFEPYKIK